LVFRLGPDLLVGVDEGGVEFELVAIVCKFNEEGGGNDCEDGQPESDVEVVCID
jgi:hypothetical protein